MKRRRIILPSLGGRHNGEPTPSPTQDEPGLEACLYCGARLRRTASAKRLGWTNLGPYADNAFCTMRCGHAFAVRAAIGGARVNPKTGRVMVYPDRIQ